MKTSFRKSFLKDLKKIKDSELLARVKDLILEVEAASSLTEIGNLKKLAGAEGAFRFRIGDYRIGLMLVRETAEFVRCLHRKDLYKYFP